MVKFEKELWKFKELKEAKSIEQTNELLDQGWLLIEATVKDGKKSFVLGKQRSLEQQKVNLDLEIEKVLEKHVPKYSERPEEKKQEVLEGKHSKPESTFKTLITGPVFLALGVGLFFYASQIQAAVSGLGVSIISENIILFVAAILAIAGAIRIFQHVVKKEEVKD